MSEWFKSPLANDDIPRSLPSNRVRLTLGVIGLTMVAILAWGQRDAGIRAAHENAWKEQYLRAPNYTGASTCLAAITGARLPRTCILPQYTVPNGDDDLGERFGITLFDTPKTALGWVRVGSAALLVENCGEVSTCEIIRVRPGVFGRS